MAANRVPTVFPVAIVLLIAWYASRERLDVGIALAIFGLLLAYARGMLAIPPVALVAVAVSAPGVLATVALVLAGLALAVAILSVFVHMSLSLGGAPASSVGPADGWYGFGGGIDGGDCGGVL